MRKRVLSVFALFFVLFAGLVISLTLSHRAQAADATKGCWYIRTDMPTPLRARAAAELDGLIYVIGGIDADGNRVDDVDVYNPSQDRWNHPGDGGDPPDLVLPRAWLVAAVVSDTIYAIGGHYPVNPSDPGGLQNKTFIVQAWKPGDAAWTPYNPTFPNAKTPMTYARDDSVVGVLGNEIYVIGGYSVDYLDYVEAYNVITDTWETKTPMPYTLAMASSGTINPTIYVFGGLDGTGATAHALAYDASSDDWTELPDMPTAKNRASAVAIGSAIYQVGGYNNTSGFFNELERFFPPNSWTTMNPMPFKRAEMAVAALGSQIFTFGGRRSLDTSDPDEAVDNVEMVDLTCVVSPPDPPANPSPPASWSPKVPLDIGLAWSDTGVEYDVFLGTDITPPLASSGLSDPNYDPPGTLEPGTRYYWHVVAYNSQGSVMPGPMWNFETMSVASVSKTASPTEVPEPGGSVDFTVQVVNDYGAAITVQGLVDDVHGDLNGKGDCSLPWTLGVGVSDSCTFSATVSGNGNYLETDTVTATIDYGTGTTDVTASATVTVTDVLPDVGVTKTATPTDLVEPGGDVEFAVEVNNNGDEPIVLDTLNDDVHGDVSNQGTCSLPQTIGPGSSYSCAFTATVTGSVGESETDTVTATVHDDENNIVEASDSASVTISEAQPGIQVVIESSVVSAQPGETITYTYTVQNIGNVPLNSVSANDNRLGGISLDKTTLAPSEVATGSAAYVVKEIDWPDGLSNTVTASGTPPVGDVVTDTDTAMVRVGSDVYLPIISNSSTSSTVEATADVP